MLVQSHREILDRQFWAAVPESGKRAVLLSGEAWCIPPRNVAVLCGRTDSSRATSPRPSAFFRIMRLARTAKRPRRGRKPQWDFPRWPNCMPRPIRGYSAKRCGTWVCSSAWSRTRNFKDWVSAAFVRLSQEAATSRYFPAMEQALDLVAGVESQRPGIARSLRSKMGIEERVAGVCRGGPEGAPGGCGADQCS